MKLLIVGNGAREHALCWKAAQSPQVKTIFVAPGNAGTAKTAKTQNLAISADDINALMQFAKENSIELTLIGPEAPLAQGIVNAFSAAGLRCFGPTQQAAELESSKVFSKTFMQQHHIPTAEFASFSELEAAIAYLKTQAFPLVIKADGLAAGKGVFIPNDLQSAIDIVTSLLQENRFGDAGHRVLIEAFLSGQELSFIVMTDGENVIPLASSQDHKRRDDGDQGPNTGGMGAYSPAPLLTPQLSDTIMQRIILPTIQGLKAINRPYLGFLYAGLMITPSGEPYVLEFNCRLGDPETQAILMRLQSDLVELCLAALDHRLADVTVQWDSRAALAVVLASQGYPDQYHKGDIIKGLDNDSQDCKIFHAGTKRLDNQVVTNGGRVLTVTALGDTLTKARDVAYASATNITWPGRFFRNDIGHRALIRA